MKYFEKEERWGDVTIGLQADEIDYKHVFHMRKVDDQVIFTEGCDHYYSRMMSKEEAIEALKEAIAWIESEE